MGSVQTRITRRTARRRSCWIFWWPKQLLCLRNGKCMFCTPKMRCFLLNSQRKIVSCHWYIDFYPTLMITSFIWLDDKMFDDILSKVQNINNSVFLQRTEDSSASQYFQFYGYLSQQQNMMQDFVRTSTYQKAIHGNFSDFNVIICDSLMKWGAKMFMCIFSLAGKNSIRRGRWFWNPFILRRASRCS